MVAKEFLEIVTILILLLHSKKVIFKVRYYLMPGREKEPEPKFGFAASWSRRQRKYFRLRNTAEKNIRFVYTLYIVYNLVQIPQTHIYFVTGIIFIYG
jgi:hypothetical protein